MDVQRFGQTYNFGNMNTVRKLVCMQIKSVMYVPNLRKIGQKLRSLSWTIGIADRRTDRQTHTQTDIHSSDLSHWTDNKRRR